MWIARTNSVVFSTKSHSDFAQHLLLNFCEEEPLRGMETLLETPGNGKKYKS
jgi:hypothetical protein